MRRYWKKRGNLEVMVLEKNEVLPATKSRFAVRQSTIGNVAVLHCTGRLCYEGDAKLLAERAQQSLRNGENVVLDLGAVHVVDSAGIGQLVLISMQAQALGKEVCIACAPDRIRMLLELTNVASLFEFFDSVDIALNSCSEQVA